MHFKESHISQCRSLKEFLDLNKISYAKAERVKSKKDGRVWPIFQLEITDPAEAEALLSQNLACNVTGIVYKVEEFRAPISVMQCYNCQCFGHSDKTCRSKQKCLICGESHSHKGYPSRENQENPHVQIVTDHMLLLAKGVRNTKSRHTFRQNVVNNQKSYPSVVSQNTLSQPKPNQTFTFTAEQLTKFVENVVIQIAQPQVCYPNPKEDTLDLKSSVCRKVSKASKNILKFDITGKDLFESIGPLSAPAHPPNLSHLRVAKETRQPNPPQNHPPP